MRIMAEAASDGAHRASDRHHDWKERRGERPLGFVDATRLLELGRRGKGE
jgi:hypothetical protein